MDLEQLLEKANANYAELKTKYDALEAQVKDNSANAELKAKFDEQAKLLEKSAETVTELKEQMADLEAKSRKMPVDAKADKEQFTTAVKSAVGAFLKSKDANQDLGSYVATHLKALNLTNVGEGKESVDEVLSTMIIERAREAYPIVGAVGRKSIARAMREEVLVSFPSVQEGIENVAGTSISETSTQKYVEVLSQIAKINAKPRITDEALYGSDLDLYGHLLRLLDDEVGRKLASQILFGNGTGKNMRGILSSNRVDAGVGGESFKPTFDATDPRSPDVYPVVSTGVASSLGASDKATVDFLINLQTALPSQYLAGSSWYMNRKTFGAMKKLRDANDNPIFSENFRGAGWSLFGFPVVLEDSMPDVAADSTPIIFGDLAQAFYMSNGDIDKMLIDPYTVDGCTVVKLDQEYFEIVGKNDAIVIAAVTTNS